MLIPSNRPAYRILAPNGFFGPDDHLYHEGDCIVYDDEPNEEMEALNEPARVQLEKFYAKLESGARKVAEKAGREYTGRPKSLDEAVAMASADARRIQLISGDGGVPLMGGRTGGKDRIGKLDESAVPETGKRGPGRPKGSGTLALGS